MKRSRVLLAVVVVAASTAGLTACSPPPAPDEPTSLTIPVDSLVSNDWDPIQGALAIYDLMEGEAVYDSLLWWDYATSTARPWLAEEFEIGDDRMTLSLKLREDVDFIDGIHMDAEGVEAYFDALLASESFALGGAVSPYAPEFSATSEYTLEVTTVKPIYVAEFFPALMDSTPVLSPGALEDPELARSEPLGSGPYVIEETTPEVETRFVRNPDYWNVEAFPFDTIVLKVIADPIAKLNALKSGQVGVAPITLSMAAEAEASGFTLHEGGGSYSTLVIRDPLNSTLEPLRDVRVRQAIMLAFDRAGINESINLGYGTVSDQAFAVGQAEYIEDADDRYGFDVDRARDLMAEAGYADGFDVVIPTEPAAGDLMPIVQQSLGDIGIRVSYEQVADNTGAFYGVAFGGQYPLVLYAIYANPNTLRLLTEKFPGLGSAFVASPEIEDLVASIKEGDEAGSSDASQRLGELVLDEVWYVPISRPASFWASEPGVSIALSSGRSVPTLRELGLGD